MRRIILCDCGSGVESEWAYDARGIPLCRVCPACEKRKLSRYRPEVLDDSNYEADEPIEPDGTCQTSCSDPW